MPNYLRGGYEFKRFAGPVVFGPRASMDAPIVATKAASAAAYGVAPDAFAFIEQERSELAAAERDIDPEDRRAVECAVKWAAEDLRVRAPRVRFFDSTKNFDYGGLVYKFAPDEIWVAADRLWTEQVTIALHEVRHIAQFDGPTLEHDSREHEAREYARSHQSWAGEAMRFVRSFS